MKLVESKNIKSGANYDNINGCVCSGGVAVANSHNKGSDYCVGYCDYGTENRHANMLVAKKG